MNEPLDLAELRARLQTARGKSYWRSLEELADTPEFQELVRREFPRQAQGTLTLSRRRFMQLTAASLAMAGLAACAAPTTGKIVPYVQQPEVLKPGVPLFFATALSLGGYAAGVLVESHEGRPTKIEGNSLHPASLGATDALTQGSLLTLYDPDRSQTVKRSGQPGTWDQFVSEVATLMKGQAASQGAGLRILTETITSPTLGSQLQALLKKYPAAKWIQYDPVSRENVRAGARMAFDQDVTPVYHFDQADVILSLDANFLQDMAAGVRYTREFTDRRRVRQGSTGMNRLYAVESTPTITGAMADHRVAQRAGQIESFARALAAQLGVKANASGGPAAHNVPDKWLNALVKDLQAHKGSSLVVVGDDQPPVVHALGHAINESLGNVGKTVTFTAPVEVNPATDSLKQLTDDMAASKVQIMSFIGTNPVYTAPADLDFSGSLSKVATKIHLGLYEDETAALCDWHIPAAHPLEGWSDARAYDGTVTIVQPLIAPLYGGKTEHELLAALLGTDPKTTGHDIVKNFWKGQSQASSFDTAWQSALRDGLIAGSALPVKPVTVQPNFDSAAGNAKPASGLEIIFQPDPTIWDGRFANNGWLQELQKPLTLLTWDNVAAISPATAERLHLKNEDLVELRYQGRTVRAPIWIQPGHPNDSVSVTLGYGRSHAGHVGSGVGFNAYAIRTSAAPWFDSGLEIAPTGQTYTLVSTQGYDNMANRDLIRATTIEQYAKNPGYVHDGESTAPAGSLYPPHPYPDHAWGMSVDTSACIGCNACIIACQAENNIPVVGKDEAGKGRLMHWLRVDRYYSGDLDQPQTDFQPVPCMQCENAPCEPVCPVGATTHSDEGLNDMTYNRCVGTRYCSNNCPYKVRHFNFFQYADFDTSSLKLMRNPNVTVRERGVMEKCTYCVQRIQSVKIAAERDGRPIQDGEIKTACQQVCPAQAIVFGDTHDPHSLVSQLKAQPHDYTLLAELNTRPRTTYLGKVRNPNPELETA